jgi:hypothetical protein
MKFLVLKLECSIATMPFHFLCQTQTDILEN